MTGIVSTPHTLALTIVITGLKLLTKLPALEDGRQHLVSFPGPSCAPEVCGYKGSSSVLPGVLGTASPKGLNRAAFGPGESQR